jgi:hypothetical protein
MFPMLPDDELDDLAADIKANGLLHPILLGEDDEGEILVDGRNRFEACRRAEVEPRFERLNGVDYAALILSANVARRSLNAGQKAAARAMLKPEGEQGKRTDLDPTSFLPKEVDVSAASLSKARFVLRHDEPLLRSVLAGAVTLNAAYEQTKDRIDNTDTAEDQRRARLDELRREKPKLARSVEDGDLQIDAAWAAYQEEKRIERARRERATGYLNRAMETLQAPEVMTPDRWAAEVFRDLDAEFFHSTPNCRMDERSIRRASDMLAALADLFCQKEADR